jgi:aminopeptidase
MEKTDFEKLAHQFMRKAIAVQAGERVWVEYQGPEAEKLALYCADAVRAGGGDPFLVDTGSALLDHLLIPMNAAEIEALGQQKLAQMKTMQGYIRIVDDADGARLTVPKDVMTLYRRAMRPMIDYRVNTTKWLVTDAPTAAFAQACGMDLPTFERFYLDVCLVDYEAMRVAAAPLQKRMAEADRVHVLSPAQGTDLTLSIKGIGAKPCTGENNIPDGECYSAPVKDSIEGTISFGPSVYEGERFGSIRLRFERGRIVDAVADTDERTQKLNAFLDTDAGARYVGEFSLNFNPYVLHPTGSILFDEKICGGLHMAAGSSYDDVSNGNKSAIHWDMVHIQRPDYGGGEIWFDDLLIRKDGLFVVPDLLPLNPANLKKTPTDSRSE